MILWDGINTDLVGWTTNPKLLNNANELFTFCTHSFSESPISRVSSVKIVDTKPSIWRWAITGFKHFVNNLGQHANPLGKAVNMESWPPLTPPPPQKKKKKNFRYSCEDSFTYTEKFASFRSSKQKKKTQFGLTKAKVFFNVSISKGKYSTFLFNSLRFKIILHPLTFLGHTKIGDMYSLFEWWAFLITPFFNNSDTSKSIACICSVEHLWLCAGFSCTGSSAKSISPWARYRNPPPPPPPPWRHWFLDSSVCVFSISACLQDELFCF